MFPLVVAVCCIRYVTTQILVLCSLYPLKLPLRLFTIKLTFLPFPTQKYQFIGYAAYMHLAWYVQDVLTGGTLTVGNCVVFMPGVTSHLGHPPVRDPTQMPDTQILFTKKEILLFHPGQNFWQENRGHVLESQINSSPSESRSSSQAFCSTLYVSQTSNSHFFHLLL